MSYRCRLCTAHVPHRRKLMKHVVTRPRRNLLGQPTGATEIAREIAVCEECKACLRSGYSPAQVAAIRAPKPVVKRAAPSTVLAPEAEAVLV